MKKNKNKGFTLMEMLIVVGIIGMVAEKVLKFAERRLTSWQEKREI